MSKAKIKKYCTGKNVVLFGCLIIPILCIRFASQEWAGRLIACLISFGVGMPACFYYALNPKIEYFKKGSKIYKYPKAVPYVRMGIRVFFILIGIVVAKGGFFPLILDSIDIAKGAKPREFARVASNVTEPFPLLSFFTQEIGFDYFGDEAHYSFLYSLRPRLRKGRKYDFVVLNKSKFILSVAECEEEEESAKLTDEEIIAVANKEMDAQDKDLSDKDVYCDLHNSEWKDTLIWIETNSPDFAQRFRVLKNRNYQAVKYDPNDPLLIGGVYWMFIDKETGEVITWFGEK